MNQRDYIREFRERGYAIFPAFFNEQEIGALRRVIEATGPYAGRQSALTKGDLVFNSNIFRRSAEARAFISQPRLIELLEPLVGPDFWVRWDQAVAKNPGAGDFPWHQDNAYSGLRDEYYQLWIALTKMDRDRGCLWLQEGSHKRGALAHRWIGNHLVYEGLAEKSVCIVAEPGDIVLFSSWMLHSTTPNVTKYDRLAYVVEYMSLDHFDPTVRPPYFVVARKGQTDPRLVSFYRGQLSFANQLMYLVPRLKGRVARARQRLRGMARQRVTGSGRDA